MCQWKPRSRFFQMLQRRTTGKLDFMKRWRQYIEGFGNKADEFWIGEQTSFSGFSYKEMKHAHTNSNGLSLLFFTLSVCLFLQVWTRYMSSPILQLSMSWGLTWAWAQRELMRYMTTLRSHQSSRSSNSLLANTGGQQVGVFQTKEGNMYSLQGLHFLSATLLK